jgi:hypothetical protein
VLCSKTKHFVYIPPFLVVWAGGSLLARLEHSPLKENAVQTLGSDSTNKNCVHEEVRARQIGGFCLPFTSEYFIFWSPI